MVKRYGVLIGVEDYHDFERTRFCHADVDLVKDTLVNHLDFAEHDLLVKLLDKQNPSSPDEILREIEARVTGAQEGDTVLFYFAGHGDRVADESFLMLPKTVQGDYERTALPLRSVNDRMRTNGRINVRIFDACRSGPDARAPGLTDQAGFMRDLRVQEGWVTLAACNENQKSYGDASLGVGGNGVFTHFLCEAIRELPEEREVGPVILFDAVCTKVRDHVSKTNEFQTPVLSGHIVGNLPFAIRKRMAAPVAVVSVAEATQPVAARLAAVKAFPSVGGKEHHAALQAAAEKLLAAATSAKSKIVSHGLETSVGPLMRADVLEGRIERSIVAYIAEKRFLTCHTAEKRTGNTPFRRMAFLTTALGPTVEHVLEQSRDWPPSTVLMHVTTDTYLPQAVLFHYLCPLQTKAVLFSGFLIAEPFQRLYEGDMTWWVDPLDLPFDGKMDDIVGRIVADFNSKFTKAVEDRLANLEREGNLT